MVVCQHLIFEHLTNVPLSLYFCWNFDFWCRRAAFNKWVIPGDKSAAVYLSALHLLLGCFVHKTLSSMLVLFRSWVSQCFLPVRFFRAMLVLLSFLPNGFCRMKKYKRVLLGCWAKANDGEHLVKVNMKDLPILLLEFVCNSRILLLPRTWKDYNTGQWFCDLNPGRSDGAKLRWPLNRYEQRFIIHSNNRRYDVFPYSC